jgi:DNA helicase-2/ATP-dependent DNA helicase PcrA
VFAIGDPDQAIYGFRGSDVGNFYRFAEDFPGTRTIELVKNYRSTTTILRGAANIIGKTDPLEALSSDNDPIFLASCRTGAEEAEMIVEQIERILGGTSYFSIDSGRADSLEDSMAFGFGDIGILFRLNAQGDALAEALTRAGIPFSRSGEAPLVSRYPANILWRFLQTVEDPDNNFYAQQYRNLMDSLGIQGVKVPGEFHSKGAVAEAIDRALDYHRLDLRDEDSVEVNRRFKLMAADFGDDMEAFLDAICLDRGIDHTCLPGDRVALMSLHAAKGLEWNVVFLTGCEDQLLPCSLFGEKDEQEEKRLFYVGTTRARIRLILSHSTLRTLNGRKIVMNPSPFLDLIGKENLRSLDRHSWKPKKKPHKQLELFRNPGDGTN